MSDFSRYARAMAAETALEFHDLEFGGEGDLPVAMTDLLANLMHLCALENLDFEVHLAMAREHFNAETGGATLEAAAVGIDEHKNCPDCGNMMLISEDHDCPAEQRRLARAAMGLDPNLDIPPFLKRGK